ncbi:hypothetical protein DY000_02022422 [Brassica cretica]|uniref:Uncharacterized protein n=1 Tax=Brassica cretica TaxID=69181 RepID=A0ABQ7DZ59_BRACR|nr:hypothetical protein DY000_02022422 [Brassica cretica]
MDIRPKTHRSIEYSEEISRRSSPSVYSEEFSDKQVILGISSEICFLRIPSENSEGFSRKEEIPRNYFRGLVSSATSWEYRSRDTWNQLKEVSGPTGTNKTFDCVFTLGYVVLLPLNGLMKRIYFHLQCVHLSFQCCNRVEKTEIDVVNVNRVVRHNNWVSENITHTVVDSDTALLTDQPSPILLLYPP